MAITKKVKQEMLQRFQDQYGIMIIRRLLSS